MCARLTEIFADVEIIRIGTDDKEHVSGLMSEYIIRVCGDIIKKLLYCFVGGFSGGCLLLSRFSESQPGHSIGDLLQFIEHEGCRSCMGKDFLGFPWRIVF